MALFTEFDLGLNATKTTALANGSLASGRPTAKAVSTAALTMGIICGYANPTSSLAQTSSLRQAEGLVAKAQADLDSRIDQLSIIAFGLPGFDEIMNAVIGTVLPAEKKEE